MSNNEKTQEDNVEGKTECDYMKEVEERMEARRREFEEWQKAKKPAHLLAPGEVRY